MSKEDSYKMRTYKTALLGALGQQGGCHILQERKHFCYSYSFLKWLAV